MNIVDLHVHSTRSDGSYTPTQLVHHAIKKGLTAFALTDHDTISGIDEALTVARGTSLEVIPGIELSTEYEGKDIHIIGLYIPYQNPEFSKQLLRFQDSRDLRNQKMCQKLQAIGIDISYEKLISAFPNSVITRAHYAQFMLNNGYITNLREAFERYIGDHCPYFVPREKVSPMEAISLILSFGGIPVLAHPPLYHLSKDRLDLLVKRLKEAGLVGIEAIYSTYNTAEERDMMQLATRYQLRISGGSDFHGDAKPGLDLATGYGKLMIPEEILMNLKKKTKILFTDLDGTLLNDEKTISPVLKSALLTALNNGHKLVLSSGRPLDSILMVKEHLELPDEGVYVSAYNGALLYDCSKKQNISEKRVSLKHVLEIMKHGKHSGVHVHTYTDSSIISPANTPELERYIKHVTLPVIINSDITSLLSQGPYKLIAINLTNKHALEDFRDSLPCVLSGEITSIFSSEFYLEFFVSSAGKGNGLYELCRLLNIAVEDSIAVGDAENDISMIEAAGLGVAMQNAHEDVKKIADMVSPQDNNHDGILAIINQYLL